MIPTVLQVMNKGTIYNKIIKCLKKNNKKKEYLKIYLCNKYLSQFVNEIATSYYYDLVNELNILNYLSKSLKINGNEKIIQNMLNGYNTILNSIVKNDKIQKNDEIQKKVMLPSINETDDETKDDTQVMSPSINESDDDIENYIKKNLRDDEIDEYIRNALTEKRNNGGKSKTRKRRFR